MRFLFTCMFALVFVVVVKGKSTSIEAGLIKNGIDTMGSNMGGWDFALDTFCNDVVNPDCVGHLALLWSYSSNCYLLGQETRFINMGKMNLDSVKQAPSDTLMAQDIGFGTGYFLGARQDSIQQYIGNVYIMKTGTDPRLLNQLYVKIRILKFINRDTATHDLDMIFLWAANQSGYPDLHTAIDTFTLDTLPVSSSPATIHKRSATQQYSARAVFKMGQNGLFVAGERGVWDLKGRKVEGRVNVARKGQ